MGKNTCGGSALTVSLRSSEVELLHKNKCRLTLDLCQAPLLLLSVLPGPPQVVQLRLQELALS